MNVELLVVPDCPHQHAAMVLMRSALDDVGLADINFGVTVIDTQEAADRRGFIGSPTIVINGADPFAEPGRPTAMACRVYPGTGGVPEPRSLREALKRGAAESPPP